VCSLDLPNFTLDGKIVILTEVNLMDEDTESLYWEDGSYKEDGNPVLYND
jgi:hypothetical protein